MARRKLVAGNWKMYTTAKAARELASGVAAGVASAPAVDVAVCPPFVWLATVAQVLEGTAVGLGAQNLYPRAEGAFTGEISPAMLKDVGCRYVIIGHSERRHVLHETDALINQKVRAGLASGLEVILCVGETLAERQANETHQILDWHFTTGLAGVKADEVTRLIVAYEPVWAIGTGLNATPEQAQDAHAFLRCRFAELYGSAAAAALRILYGGSVKPDNAASLMRMPDVDGALVGGASLKPDSFLGIVQAAG